MKDEFTKLPKITVELPGKQTVDVAGVPMHNTNATPVWVKFYELEQPCEITAINPLKPEPPQQQ